MGPTPLPPAPAPPGGSLSRLPLLWLRSSPQPSSSTINHRLTAPSFHSLSLLFSLPSFFPPFCLWPWVCHPAPTRRPVGALTPQRARRPRVWRRLALSKWPSFSMTPTVIMSVLLCSAAQGEMELAEAQWEQPSLELDQQPTKPHNFHQEHRTMPSPVGPSTKIHARAQLGTDSTDS